MNKIDIDIQLVSDAELKDKVQQIVKRNGMHNQLVKMRKSERKKYWNLWISLFMQGMIYQQDHPTRL